MSANSHGDPILSGRVPARVVMESGRVLAFEHTQLTWETRMVFIPKRHVRPLIVVGDASLFGEVFNFDGRHDPRTRFRGDA